MIFYCVAALPISKILPSPMSKMLLDLKKATN